MSNLSTSDKKHPGGRPTIMTEQVIKKLEEAFAIGCSDAEACFYADISHQTLYSYQAKHPKFVERKEALKERPVMLARRTVVNAISTDSKLAMDYLKAKRSDEFAERRELTGAEGRPIELMAVPFEELLEEAASLGIDTSPYAELNSGDSQGGTPPQDSTEEGT